MKDLQSSRGGLTHPAGEDPGLVKGVVVRNKGVYGRRIGIFSDAPELVAGADLHAADYRLIPELLEDTDGFLTGIELELAGTRVFHEVFSFDATTPFETMHSQMSEVVATSNLKAGQAYLPSEVNTLLPTGLFDLPINLVGLNYFSFTLIHNGKTHELGLDVSKHPAKITADLNYALAEISPDLRGLVAVSEPIIDTTFRTVTWSISFACGSNTTLRFPMTNVVYQPVPLGQGPDLTTIGYFQPEHLNNKLTQLIEVKKTTVTGIDSTKIVDPNFAGALTVQQLVDGALLQHRDGTLSPNHLTYSVDIQKTSFAPMKQDTRFKVKLIMLSNNYDNSDFRYLQKVEYSNAGVKTPADLLVVPRGDSGYGTRLIDVDESIRLNKLVGVSEEVLLASDAEQALPETGGSNYSVANGHIYGSRFAIAVVAQGESYKRFSPLYRETLGGTSLVLTYTKDTLPIPQYHLDPMVLDWSKEADELVHVGFSIDTLRGGEITKVKAIHSSGTITDVTPLLTPGTGKVRVDLNQGFSARAMTFDRMTGSLTFITDMSREAENQSAKTQYELQARLDYTVVTPALVPVMTLSAPAPFVIDVDNDDKITINGQINISDLDHNLMYYVKSSTLSAKLKGVPLTTAFTLPTPETDNDGKFIIQPKISDFSKLGVGKHELEITLAVKTYWNQNISRVETVLVTVMPQIEGVEDDFTFITPAIANGDLNTASKMRLVDSDTGEILAEGNSVNELTASAASLDLVDFSLIKSGIAPIVPEDYTGTIRSYTKAERLAKYAPEGFDETPREDIFSHKLPLGDYRAEDTEVILLNTPVNMLPNGTEVTLQIERTFPNTYRLNGDNPFGNEAGLPDLALVRKDSPYLASYQAALAADPDTVVWKFESMRNGLPFTETETAGNIVSYGPPESPNPFPDAVSIFDGQKFVETRFGSDGVEVICQYAYNVEQTFVNNLPVKSTLPVGNFTVEDFLDGAIARGKLAVNLSQWVMPNTFVNYSEFRKKYMEYIKTSIGSPFLYYMSNMETGVDDGLLEYALGSEGLINSVQITTEGDLNFKLTGVGEMIAMISLASADSLKDLTLPNIPNVTVKVADDEIPEIGLYVKSIILHIACAD